MGRILKIRSGPPIPAASRSMAFRLTRKAEALLEAAAECVLAPTGLFWEDPGTGLFDSEEDITEYVESVSGWQEYTDDSSWQCVGDCIAWNGSYWAEDGSYMKMRPAGGAIWHLGFRPTLARVEYTCTNPPIHRIAFRSHPGGGTTLAVVNDYVSMETITFLGNDVNIGSLEFYNTRPDLHITKIEFFG